MTLQTRELTIRGYLWDDFRKHFPNITLAQRTEKVTTIDDLYKIVGEMLDCNEDAFLCQYPRYYREDGSIIVEGYEVAARYLKGDQQ